MVLAPSSNFVQLSAVVCAGKGPQLGQIQWERRDETKFGRRWARIVRNKQFVFGLRITFLVTKAPLGGMQAADDGAHRAAYGAGFWEFLRS
jgi:hypothetical protein